MDEQPRGSDSEDGRREELRLRIEPPGRQGLRLRHAVEGRNWRQNVALMPH
jgi:hypothetical protein